MLFGKGLNFSRCQWIDAPFFYFSNQRFVELLALRQFLQLFVGIALCFGRQLRIGSGNVLQFEIAGARQLQLNLCQCADGRQPVGRDVGGCLVYFIELNNCQAAQSADQCQNQ